MMNVSWAIVGYPLLEVLGRYSVFAGAEMFKHRHSPYGLVIHPASIGEQREPGNEFSHPEFRSLVLLYFDREQLNRPTHKVRVESPSDAGVIAPEVVRLEAARILAR
jgi:hypothetical protein